MSNPTPEQRTLLATSVEWMTTFFDADFGLLRHPSAIQHHAVRESLWYAAGLLAQGDATPRALGVVDAVLALQFDEPGAVWDGTWPRAPEERRPITSATVFADYDPNWRQFIGCVLGLLARDFAQVLGPSRCERIEAAIVRAIRGEGSDRIIATYTNIALMQAWLLAEYGDRAHGERLAATVEDLYRDEAGFREFNSPTYYGVDLWALALWRRSGSSSLVAAGRRLEAALWRDIAAFYHAGLRNLCGPFDRAYGMDMTRYASLLGLWLWWACGDAARAFPDPKRPFAHAHDFCATPLLALAPPLVEGGTRAALMTVGANRAIERRGPKRTVTATLRDDLMLGAVAPAHRDGTGQAMPVTAHWAEGTGTVAWLCIRGVPLDGTVTDGAIELSGDAELTLRVAASVSCALGGHEWRIGSRRIGVTGIEAAPLLAYGDGVQCALRLPSGEGRLVFG